MTQSPPTLSRRLLQPRLALAFAALLFLWFLGGHDLWAPDEPYFAEGAREMVVDGRWAVPHVNGVVTTDKPPMFFWLIALLSSLTGSVTSWTARLPSALAGLGTLLLTMRLGRRWYGERTAALAGLILATSYLFWEKARWSQTDATLCFFIWLALSAFEAARAGESDPRKAGSPRRAGLLFWLAAAGAVLTKGPVGLLLPLGIAVAVLIGDRNLGLLKRFAPVTGPALFALTTGLWAWAAETSGYDYSILGALREHFVDRGIEGMHHPQPFWYFAEVLPVMLLPWTGLLPGAVLMAWRRRRERPGDRFALTAALFVLVFFSISTEKRELYSLPAFPAFALLFAAFIATLLHLEVWRPEGGSAAAQPNPALPGWRWLAGGHSLIGALLALAGAALPFLRDRAPLVPVPTVIALSLTLVVTGTAMILLARRRSAGVVWATACGVATLYLLVAAAVYPTLEPIKSGRSFALTIKEMTAGSRAEGLPVVSWGLSNLPETFSFYSDGVYLLEAADPEVLYGHLERDETVWALVRGDRLDTLRPEIVERMRVRAETQLARRPVLLVTNDGHARVTREPQRR